MMFRFVIVLLFVSLLPSSIVCTPFDRITDALYGDDRPSVRYTSTACTCTPSTSARTTTTAFTSEEGYGFSLTSSVNNDCVNTVTTFTLTSTSSQSLSYAAFYVQYGTTCPPTEDCSQIRCSDTSTGTSSITCSYPKPSGYSSEQYVYVLWRTPTTSGNRQYPVPSPGQSMFIPLNLDCSVSTTSYTSTCSNGVCACQGTDYGSTCPTGAPTTQIPPTTTSPPTSTPVTTSSGPTPSVPTPSSSSSGQRLIFDDEFDKLDFSIWEHELTLAGDGNWCFQQYTNNRTNTYVKNGILYIKPSFTSDVIGDDAVRGTTAYTMDLGSLEPAMQCTGPAFYGCQRTSNSTISNYLNPIQSAAIRTAKSFSFKYGRVEIRAQLPRGDWLWPAMWLLPKYAEYGQWPMSGEIDILESRGNAPSYPYDGNDVFGSTLHWGPYYPHDPFALTHKTYKLPAGQSFADSFHTFGLYWDATGIYTYVDQDSNRVLQVNWTTPTPHNNYFYDLAHFDTTLDASNPWQYSSSPGAPFDQEFYLILDVSVGGGDTDNGLAYFPEDPNRPWTKGTTAMKQFWDNQASWKNTWQGEQSALKVDWIRVWQ